MIDSVSRRALLAGGLVMAAGPGRAQSDAGLLQVAMKTSKGTISLDLNIGRAPITARNFLRYVDLKRFDHCSFYRTSHIEGQPTEGLIEGGLRNDPARVLKPIAHESTLKTGLTHKDGTISMARARPGTATADFFICIGDQPDFDANPVGAGDKDGYAAFGQVTGGMDVVQVIFDLPTSPTAGAGVMRGEMLKPPVPILTVRRVG